MNGVVALSVPVKVADAAVPVTVAVVAVATKAPSLFKTCVPFVSEISFVPGSQA